MEALRYHLQGLFTVPAGLEVYAEVQSYVVDTGDLRSAGSAQTVTTTVVFSFTCSAVSKAAGQCWSVDLVNTVVLQGVTSAHFTSWFPPSAGYGDITSYQAMTTSAATPASSANDTPWLTAWRVALLSVLTVLTMFVIVIVWQNVESSRPKPKMGHPGTGAVKQDDQGFMPMVENRHVYKRAVVGARSSAGVRLLRSIRGMAERV